MNIQQQNISRQPSVPTMPINYKSISQPKVEETQSQPPVPTEESNPFQLDQYRNIGIPDVPVQYGGGMTDVLLNDVDIPEAIRKKFWFVFNKDNVLTFLDEDRKRSKMLNFDLIRIDLLNSMPYYQYNFDFELEWDILRNAFETKLDRALGFKGGNVKNERIVLQSQFTEQRQISEQGRGGDIREGFFKRLLGRR